MNDRLAVRQVRRFGEDVFELQLERGGIPFVPGDCMALYTEDGRVSRPYSLASGNEEEILRFVIRRMAGGEVSPYLAGRKPGDLVRVSPPFGWFRPGAQRALRPCVFVATGTGIAPFLAYLRSTDEVTDIPCYYGVRYHRDAVDGELLASHCRLHVAVSRERVSAAAHGRVTDLLGKAKLAQDADYYICGLDAMIDEVTRLLESRGVPLAQIHRECFFNASYA